MLKASNIIILLIVGVSILSCNPAEKNEKYTIVTTTGIIADCIQNMVSDEIEVVSLMGAGVDPHLYRASQGDIVKLTNADIIVYNGLHLEGKMAKMLENYAKQKTVLSVGDFIDPSKLRKIDQSSDLVDPHIWFSPEIWMSGFDALATELSNTNEKLHDTRAKFVAYNAQVSALSVALENRLDSLLPNEKRILITSHDAFSYFGDAFDFKVRGLQGISTAAEFGAKDVKDLIDFIIDNDIKAVFVETSVSDKNLKAVIEGANARGYELKVGGTLYSDALGETETDAGSYMGMLEANVNTVIQGLK